MDASHFIDLFLNLGLFGMVVIALVEKFVPIVPSYVMLMLLGMTVSGSTTLVMAILATAAGSLTGSMAWYGIGRTLGAQRVERAVARFGKYVFFSLGAYERLANAYRRNHFRATLIGQTVPVARIYLALPAGVFRLRPVAFVVAAAFGILLWNTPFLTLGYFLRGGGHDPVDVGFWVSVTLVGTEMAIVLGIRLCGSIAHRSNRSNRGAAIPVQYANSTNAIWPKRRLCRPLLPPECRSRKMRRSTHSERERPALPNYAGKLAAVTPDRRDPSRIGGNVMSGLSWSTPDGTPLSTDVNLTFGTECTGIVGRNGTGTSDYPGFNIGSSDPGNSHNPKCCQFSADAALRNRYQYGGYGFFCRVEGAGAVTPPCDHAVTLHNLPFRFVRHSGHSNPCDKRDDRTVDS